MTEAECRQLLENIAESRHEVLKEEEIRTYTSHLKDLPFRRAGRGVLTLIRQFDGKWFPSVAIIRRFITEAKDEEFDDAKKTRYEQWLLGKDAAWSFFITSKLTKLKDANYMKYIGKKGGWKRLQARWKKEFDKKWVVRLAKRASGTVNPSLTGTSKSTTSSAPPSQAVGETMNSETEPSSSEYIPF
jgi:hypothetical protein|tara:strand:+ start:1723 stop:2283 length:561 start_codon:yes stop_codon:yes gene_type:complete